MNITIIDSTFFDSVKRRIVKVLRFGKTDVNTGYEVSPFGFDGNPLSDMRAIFADTNRSGRRVIIGYINKNQLAQPGESRLFSVDSNGNLKTFIWLKNDGSIELGGTNDNLVRFSKLEEAFNELQGKFNTFAQAYTPGSPASVGTPPFIEQSNSDISEAKIDNLKIP